MRFDEFTTTNTNNPESNLVTALELIRHRYKDEDKLPKISTQSVINLVLNTDKTFDYDALVNANKTNKAVQNIIKNFNKDYVELNPIGIDNQPSATTTNVGNAGSTDTVSKMAKRAGKKRSTDIF